MDGRRQAYTLFELVIVLAVLVVVGAISLPAIRSMMSDRQVDVAADVVRTHFSNSRSHAMSEGRSYRFAYQENSGKFRIAPDSPEYWDETGSSTDDSDDKAWILEAELPGEIRFATAKVGSSSGGAEASGTSSWRRVATFLADGTAKEDAEIAIARAGAGQGMTLKLRGSTGAVSTGEGPRP